MIDFYDAEFDFQLCSKVYRNLPGHNRPTSPRRTLRQPVKSRHWMATVPVVIGPDSFRLQVCPAKVLGTWNCYGSNDLRALVTRTAPLVLQRLGHRLSDEQLLDIRKGKYRLHEVHVAESFCLLNYSHTQFIEQLFFALGPSRRLQYARRGTGFFFNPHNRRVSAYLYDKCREFLARNRGYDRYIDRLWAPLIFLAIDRAFLLATEKLISSSQISSCIMLGSFALAMQVFAGHPQYVFTTGLAASVYVGLRLIATRRRWTVMAVLVSFVLIGLSLSAVQWMAGLQANAETIRSAPVPYEFAKMFAFPPENALTLLAPGLFGDMSAKFPYWGRCYLWEMSVFMGVSGIVAVAYGIYRCDRQTSVPLLIAIAILTMLALGSHTPAFEWLYQYVPGFNKFRGMSKFTFPMSLFLVILAAHGFDRMTRVSLIEPRIIRALYGLGIILLAAALLAGVVNWRVILLAVNATGESYFPAALIDDPKVIADVGKGAAASLFLAAATTGLLALLLRRIGQVTYAPYLLLALTIAEMMLFAAGTREKFEPKDASFEYIAEFGAKHPGDYRILNTLAPNSALSVNAQDLWGADPGVERRYAEFMAFTQDADPDVVTQNVAFAKPSPLYAMLRLRYVFLRNEQDVQVVEMVSPMARFHLLSRYRVVSGRDAIFKAMNAPDFDPNREVLLETLPDPMPSSNVEINATVRTIASSTDWWEVEVDIPHASILLMTDSYGAAWRATGLSGSVQSAYQLQPANYILRAIPLIAGHHHFRIEYAPASFDLGKWISLISWLLFVIAGFAFLFVCGGRRRAFLN